MQVRAMVRADWPAALALNEESVIELSALDEQGLRHLLECTHRALTAEDDGEIVAFALAIAQGSPYDNLNYAWFSERFESFLYLDRIAVDPGYRRRGIAARVYDEMENAARALGRMVCEVNIEPRNDASLAFHAARGYSEIGRLEHPGKVVTLLCKELGKNG